MWLVVLPGERSGPRVVAGEVGGEIGAGWWWCGLQDGKEAAFGHEPNGRLVGEGGGGHGQDGCTGYGGCGREGAVEIGCQQASND